MSKKKIRFQFKGRSRGSFHFSSRPGNPVFSTRWAYNLQEAINSADKEAVDWETVQDNDGNFIAEYYAGEWMTLAEAAKRREETDKLPDVF
jgi:hypothetical protein